MSIFKWKSFLSGRAAEKCRGQGNYFALAERASASARVSVKRKPFPTAPVAACKLGLARAHDVLSRRQKKI